MNYFRAHICLYGQNDAVKFVSLLNSDGTPTKYMLENSDATERVNARSLLGVLYFITEHSDDTWFINMTDPDMPLPSWIDGFRA